MALFIVAPIPRPPSRSEKTYETIGHDGKTRDAQQLPCWQDAYDAHCKVAQERGEDADTIFEIEEADVFMSLVVPAFNEEQRLGAMLKEATDYLQYAYGDSTPHSQANGKRAKRKDASQMNGHVCKPECRGWEVLVVSDGSTDNTVDTALDFANSLGADSAPGIRVIRLHENRGKGGAVTHGMRHARGQYAIFADADGASKFEDLGKLVRASQKIEDTEGRGVAVGSRAHLVGSEAVVKVCSHLFEDIRMLRSLIAFISPQPPHAFFSSSPSCPHTSSYGCSSRYAVWFQAVFKTIITVHHSLHALRRLDIRC